MEDRAHENVSSVFVGGRGVVALLMGAHTDARGAVGGAAAGALIAGLIAKHQKPGECHAAKQLALQASIEANMNMAMKKVCLFCDG